MKNIKILVIVCLSTLSFGQVVIGKESIEGNSTLLDFNNTVTNTQGLILSAVETTPTGYTSANNGTFLFDKSDQKLKMYENNKWVDLSKESGNGSVIVANTSVEKGGGAIIGNKVTAAKGVLVLESIDKALILPRIKEPHLNVKSPYPGMMCYDTKSKSVALFDGKVWNYWK